MLKTVTKINYMNATHLESIGKNIRDMRQHREMTQTQLAEAAGLRVATISDIEKGKLNFEINTLVRIAAALNCYLELSLTPAKKK